MSIISKSLHAVAIARHAIRRRHDTTKRSSAWPLLEHRWLTKHPTCAACGGTVRLAVHHKVPFHVDPSRELDETNLITLCMAESRHCHLHFGHGRDFRAYVDSVESYTKVALSIYTRYEPALQKDLDMLKARARLARRY